MTAPPAPNDHAEHRSAAVAVDDDPILRDPVLAAALEEFARPPSGPDLTAPILASVHARRGFVKRRRRRRIRQARYAVAAAVVVLIGGVAVLHRLAPESTRTTALDRPVSAVAEALETDTRAGRERLAGVAGELADLTTAVIGQGALGLSPGGIDRRFGLGDLGGMTFDGASGALFAFGPDTVAADAPAADAPAAVFDADAFEESLRAMVERPLSAARVPQAPLDALDDRADMPGVAGDPAVNAPAVIDLGPLLLDPTLVGPTARQNRQPSDATDRP